MPAKPLPDIEAPTLTYTFAKSRELVKSQFAVTIVTITGSLRIRCANPQHRATGAPFARF
jgi:hypothetical protein